MNLNKFDFIKDLEKEYDRNPAFCSECGKILSFKKFYEQFDNPYKYCSKKCKIVTSIQEEYITPFSSETEKTIYAYLTLQYPYYIIKHNVSFLTYEIDMNIQTPNMSIWIEYNGQFHMQKKNKKLENAVKRHQVNDIIKKNEICDNMQQKLIRIWCKGLYSRPILFNDCLMQLKDQINYLVTANNLYGQCIDIIADTSDNKVYCYKEKYKNEIYDILKNH